MQALVLTINANGSYQIGRDQAQLETWVKSHKMTTEDLCKMILKAVKETDIWYDPKEIELTDGAKVSMVVFSRRCVITDKANNIMIYATV